MDELKFNLVPSSACESIARLLCMSIINFKNIIIMDKNVINEIKSYLKDHLNININKYYFGGRTALYELELKLGNDIISKVKFYGTNS